MRVCVQRVAEAYVEVDGHRIASIGPGILVLLGVAGNDTVADVATVSEKLAHLRIFEDEEGKMNRSLLDTGGAALVVSQFTLYADCRKGRRPSFTSAAVPDLAQPLYEEFSRRLASHGIPVAQGRFRATMRVGLVNDGPVTIWLATRDGTLLEP